MPRNKSRKYSEELLEMVKELMAAIDSGDEMAMLGETARAEFLILKVEGVIK